MAEVVAGKEVAILDFPSATFDGCVVDWTASSRGTVVEPKRELLESRVGTEVEGTILSGIGFGLYVGAEGKVNLGGGGGLKGVSARRGGDF